MKKTLFLGENGAGKEELIQILSDKELKLKKTMAVEFYGDFINIPNEFLEKNRWFMNSIITASFDAEIIIVVISALQRSTLLPPLLAPLFNKKVLGVITYKEYNETHFVRARKFLENAGIKDSCIINLVTKEGAEEIKKILE